MKKSLTYRSLLDAFRAYAGLESNGQDPEAFYRVADVVVDGIAFSLMPGEGDNDNCLLFYCDFGALPVDLEGLAMSRLLEANLMVLGPGRPSFGLNFTTGNVLLAGAVPLGRLDARTLAAMLHHYASKAKEWRGNYFLLEEERSRGSTPPEVAVDRLQQTHRTTERRESGARP